MPNLLASTVSCGHLRCACNSEIGKGLCEDLKTTVSNISGNSKCFLCLRCVKASDTEKTTEKTCRTLGKPCRSDKTQQVQDYSLESNRQGTSLASNTSA